MVNPFAFCQFEIQAGIRQSSISYLVNLRGGDRRITGGSPSEARMIFLCLCLGGSKGSLTQLEIWIMRCIPGCEAFVVVGVYLTN
jgi:hypothetical protein